MLDSFRELGCYMSIKVHFLFSKLERFPENLGSVSDEQGGDSIRKKRDMEERYQGGWDTQMMADYCWNIARYCPEGVHTRKAKKRSLAV